VAAFERDQTAVEPAVFPEQEVPREAHHAYLVVISGDRLGQRFVLDDRPVELGRSGGVGLVLDRDSVSRRHALLEWANGTHRIIDLGSTNGTFVNEQRVTTAQLTDGDRVGLGKVLLKYLAGTNIEAEYHSELQRLARHDGLTGIHNRRHFEELLRENTSGSSLLILDLDHFKAINDEHGHTCGDVVLREVALACQRELPPDCLLARVGGEEFAVICSQHDAAAAVHIAEQLRALVARLRPVYDGKEIPITVSIGVAERGANEPGQAWFERADAALYRAKAAGRNRVVS
jgi:diguanylate cyclase (GGDEF)-like protein